ARRPPKPKVRVRAPPSTPANAGEVLKGGRSARTREEAGSIPAAGPPPFGVPPQHLSLRRNAGDHNARPLRRPGATSLFSSDARWGIPPVASSSGELHGPEALTAERPVETRQGEVRALPGPPTRGATAAHLRDRQGPEVRLLPRRRWPKPKWSKRRVVAPEEAG